MTPTPEDIRKAQYLCIALSIPATEGTKHVLAQALASEREAERERCEGIADAGAEGARKQRAKATSAFHGTVAEAVETAIRIISEEIRRSEP